MPISYEIAGNIELWTTQKKVHFLSTKYDKIYIPSKIYIKSINKAIQSKSCDTFTTGKGTITASPNHCALTKSLPLLNMVLWVSRFMVQTHQANIQAVVV